MYSIEVIDIINITDIASRIPSGLKSRGRQDCEINQLAAAMLPNPGAMCSRLQFSGRKVLRARWKTRPRWKAAVERDHSGENASGRNPQQQHRDVIGTAALQRHRHQLLASFRWGIGLHSASKIRISD